MRNKGFTLVEVLAVIIIISLITVIAVPSIQSANNKTKEKILNTKISYAKSGLLSWSQDNENCFISELAMDCIVGVSNGCTTSGDILTCQVNYDKLLEFNIIKYDKIENGKELVINPVTNQQMNNEKIIIKYDKTKRTFKVE